MTILDQVAVSSAKLRYGRFQPTTVQEFFALRLATKLGDASAARHYAELTEKFSSGQVLEAYARALQTKIDIARRFHLELESLKDTSVADQNANCLASVRIERRAIGLAILRGDRLVHADARQLSSVPDKALDNAISFVTRFLDRFRCDSAAMEMIPYGQQAQRTLLHQNVQRVLSAQGINIIDISKVALLAAFGYPPPRFRNELRDTLSSIYPMLDQQPGGPWIHDATALGLFVQTERLFNTINQIPL